MTKKNTEKEINLNKKSNALFDRILNVFKLNNKILKELENIVTPVYKAQLVYMYEYKEMTAKEISNILKIKTTDVYNYINHNTIPRENIIVKLEDLFLKRFEVL